VGFVLLKFRCFGWVFSDLRFEVWRMWRIFCECFGTLQSGWVGVYHITPERMVFVAVGAW